MRLMKEREAEIRGRKLQREGESKTFLDPDIQLLFAEIDYLRDSFLDMGTIMRTVIKERDQLHEKLNIAIEALEFYNKFPDRATVHSIGGGTAFSALAKIKEKEEK